MARAPCIGGANRRTGGLGRTRFHRFRMRLVNAKGLFITVFGQVLPDIASKDGYVTDCQTGGPWALLVWCGSVEDSWASSTWKPGLARDRWSRLGSSTCASGWACQSTDINKVKAWSRELRRHCLWAACLAACQGLRTCEPYQLGRRPSSLGCHTRAWCRWRKQMHRMTYPSQSLGCIGRPMPRRSF